MNSQMQTSNQPTVPRSTRSKGSFWRSLFFFNSQSSASRTPAEVSSELPGSGLPGSELPGRELPDSALPDSGCVLEAFGYSDKGRVRQNNEDYFRIEPHIGLYAVADGMGGAEAGEYASRLAVDVVA